MLLQRKCGLVAQLVEQLTLNQRARGSSPRWPTFFQLSLKAISTGGFLGAHASPEREACDTLNYMQMLVHVTLVSPCRLYSVPLPLL